VRVAEQGGEAVMQVDDEGPGMAPDFIPQACQPFRRMSSSTDGSGLGLAIASDAALRLGGTIELRNRQDAAGFSFVYRQRLAPRA
jgi:signal transduction histidine kinase